MSSSDNQSNNVYGYVERPDNAVDREYQANSNGNEEIQLGSTGNQRNPLDPSWTEKARCGRDAVILRSRRGRCSTHSGSCSNAVQSNTKCTCRMEISRIQNHQSIIPNKEGGDHNEYFPMLCTHK
ncbi:unnamed protein product [Schistosoma curassoni]|uniref:Uncharacterized protein n=1 Tax=Schistosoma curassoni TaxID=6186 RepID=A0A183KIY4_9TREM|nr:unnamed protein product [Schistosoma curassoni]